MLRKNPQATSRKDKLMPIRLLYNQSQRKLAVFQLLYRFCENWWTCCAIYLLRKPIEITFRNGFKGSFDWASLYKIIYLLENKVVLKQISGDVFEIDIDELRLRAPIKYVLEYTQHLDVLYDGNEDYQNKVLVDIGAYIGDTALYFWTKGVSKIICYEPLQEFFIWLNENIKLNGVNAQLYNLGISDHCGTVDITYPEIFGDRSFEIKIRKLNEILKRHRPIDIIKFECEGCEECILYLSDDELRAVPVWIIEAHSSALLNSLISKFTNAGYECRKIVPRMPKKGWFVVHFVNTNDPLNSVQSN